MENLPQNEISSSNRKVLSIIGSDEFQGLISARILRNNALMGTMNKSKTLFLNIDSPPGASVKKSIIDSLFRSVGDGGEKVLVFRNKRRKGYRIKNGHRQYFTKISLPEIDAFFDSKESIDACVAIMCGQFDDEAISKLSAKFRRSLQLRRTIPKLVSQFAFRKFDRHLKGLTEQIEIEVRDIVERIVLEFKSDTKIDKNKISALLFELYDLLFEFASLGIVAAFTPREKLSRTRHPTLFYIYSNNDEEENIQHLAVYPLSA